MPELRLVLVDLGDKIQSRDDIAPREMAAILGTITAILEAINGD